MLMLIALCCIAPQILATTLFLLSVQTPKMEVRTIRASLLAAKPIFRFGL